MSKIKIAIDRSRNFLQTTYNYLASGGETVPLEEAIRRSEICKGCEFNKPEGKRGGCVGCFSRKAVMFLYGFRDGRHKWHDGAIDSKNNPHNNDLTFCGKCGCVLKVKVFLPLGTIQNEGIEYPSHCWQLDEPEENSD